MGSVPTDNSNLSVFCHVTANQVQAERVIYDDLKKHTPFSSFLDCKNTVNNTCNRKYVLIVDVIGKASGQQEAVSSQVFGE